MSHFLLNLVRRSAGLPPLVSVEPRLPAPINKDLSSSAFGEVIEEEMQRVTAPPDTPSVQTSDSHALDKTPPREQSVTARTDSTQLLKPVSQLDSDRARTARVAVAVPSEASQITIDKPDVAKPEFSFEQATEHVVGPIGSIPPTSQTTAVANPTFNQLEVVSPQISAPVLAPAPIPQTNIIQRTVESVPASAPAAPASTAPTAAEPLAALRVVAPPVAHSQTYESRSVIESEPSMIPQVETRPATVVKPRPPRLPAIPLVFKQTDQPAARPVHVRIGTIEVQGSPPSPASPTSTMPASNSPASEGFGDYIGMRTYVSWDRP